MDSPILYTPAIWLPVCWAILSRLCFYQERLDGMFLEVSSFQPVFYDSVIQNHGQFMCVPLAVNCGGSAIPWREENRMRQEHSPCIVSPCILLRTKDFFYTKVLRDLHQKEVSDMTCDTLNYACIIAPKDIMKSIMMNIMC